MTCTMNVIDSNLKCLTIIIVPVFSNPHVWVKLISMYGTCLLHHCMYRTYKIKWKRKEIEKIMFTGRFSGHKLLAEKNKKQKVIIKVRRAHGI